MLHVRVVAPRDGCDAVVSTLRDDPAVVSLVVLRDVGVVESLDLVQFDVAREAADAVLDALRATGVEETGSVSVEAADTVLSRAAERAEAAAPGHPDDGVVWGILESRSAEDARLSASFVVFLVLATLIAGVGRYLDQPILIIGAMVVGPEFAAIAALCVGIATRRPALVLASARTLAVGFAVAVVVALAFWSVVHLVGGLDVEKATTGELTDFIVSPDVWSFVIALLAGAAGVLSLAASKSSVLVGVFISVTTVPAIGTVALTVAVGAWGEAAGSLLQLGVNLAGMVLAGTVVLVALRLLWRRVPSTVRRPR